MNRIALHRLAGLAGAALPVLAQPVVGQVAGTVAWGNNDINQLGGFTACWAAYPEYVNNGSNGKFTGIKALAAGGRDLANTSCVLNSTDAGFSLALKTDGSVWAWGSNNDGQLGNASAPFSTTFPVQVSNLSGVTAIAAGFKHALALKSDGSVWAWGSDSHGQLGNGTSGDSPVPVQVIAPNSNKPIIAIAAGDEHSLALRKDGVVFAWGSDQYGQLGDNASYGAGGDNRASPVQVSFSSGGTVTWNVLKISAGSHHSNAVLVGSTGNREVWGWGRNHKAQVGTGASGNPVPLPVHAAASLDAPEWSADGYLRVLDIDGGREHTVCVRQGRAPTLLNPVWTAPNVWGWGDNAFRQLSLTAMQIGNPAIPKAIGGGWADRVTAGDEHTAVLTINHQTGGTRGVVACGRQTHGQLGRSVNLWSTHPFTAVAGVSGVGTLAHVTALASGGDHVLAYTAPPSPPPCSWCVNWTRMPFSTAFFPGRGGGGGVIRFEAGVAEPGNVTYQWRLNGVSLESNGRISGANEPTLTIHEPEPRDEGAYDLVVSWPGGSSVSDPAYLIGDRYHDAHLLAVNVDARAVMVVNPLDASVIDPTFIEGAPHGMRKPIEAIQVGEEIWVSDQLADAIFIFALDGSFLRSIRAGLDDPRGMALADGKVYVANFGAANGAPGEAVVILDAASGTLLGSFPAQNPFDVLAHNGELLVTNIQTEDIHSYAYNGAFLGVFHDSDGVNGIDFPGQLSHRAGGSVLAAGFSPPAGLYEFDERGKTLAAHLTPAGARGVHELGNGQYAYTTDTGLYVLSIHDGSSTLVTPGQGRFITLARGLILDDPCYADCERNGALDIFDFLCFQNLFSQNDPYACDCDATSGPGTCDIFDFLCFQNEFSAGCP